MPNNMILLRPASTGEQRALIVGQQFRLYRKRTDGFHKCFLLIVSGSFVIIFNRKMYPTPLKKITISIDIKNIWGSGPDLLVLVLKKRTVFNCNVLITNYSRPFFQSIHTTRAFQFGEKSQAKKKAILEIIRLIIPISATSLIERLLDPKSSASTGNRIPIKCITTLDRLWGLIVP